MQKFSYGSRGNSEPATLLCRSLMTDISSTTFSSCAFLFPENASASLVQAKQFLAGKKYRTKERLKAHEDA